MSYYRVYYLSLDGQHIVDVNDFDAAGDDAALLSIKCGEVGVPRELWNLDRKVMDFPPQACPAD